ncbi:MAG: 1-deoxy-D-xylulose-5-phosphate reductoisomerase [Pyrinomonadaceae bacterium]
MHAISILGSTGSIGTNTLRVVEALGDPFKVVALGAKNNVARLAAQIAQFKPSLVSVEGDESALKLRAELQRLGITPPKICTGEAGLIEVATHSHANTVVSATVGAVGLVPTLRALEAGKRVALANKETLVMAGELMTKAAAISGAELLPVDSEHNALHQCLRGERKSEVRRLILTASGGPFRGKDRKAMDVATVEEAMLHPTWRMGPKITIDSATLMNKGLEVIEAHWLFGFAADQIEIVVHPESVLHSMVEFIDGSLIAQLGVTDMRHAIQYALTYPERHKTRLPSLELAKLSTLHFEEPDRECFPCISLAYQALRRGGTSPAVLSAANEEAVKAFIEGRLRLTEIPQIIEQVMTEVQSQEALSLEAVLEADRQARASALMQIDRLSNEPVPQVH